MVTYERAGAAAVLTIDRPERRNAVDGPTAERLEEGYRAFEADPRPGPDPDRRGRPGVLRRCRPEGDRDLRPAPGGAGRPARLHARDIAQADDRRDLGLVPGRRARAPLWCDLRIAAEGARARLPERRWGVPLIDGGTQRLPRIVGLGRGLDLILTGRIVEHAEALAMGLLTEVVAPGAHLGPGPGVRRGARRFPQETMLADRRSAIAGLGLPLADGLALEATAGPAVFADAQAGAARFAGGAGRGGAGAGV